LRRQVEAAVTGRTRRISPVLSNDHRAETNPQAGRNGAGTEFARALIVNTATDRLSSPAIQNPNRERT
jgi:hypothetical protein